MPYRTALLCLLVALLPVDGTRPRTPLGGTGEQPIGNRLARPVPLEADGRRLLREDGCLFPFVGDIDGDGRQELLLGTRTVRGQLLIYPNVGTKSEPRLGAPRWFDDAVPSGRIPAG